MTERGGRVHPDLRKDHRNALTGGLLPFGLLGVAIIVGVFALRPLTPPLELLRDVLYASPGAGLVALAGFEARSAAWYRRCSDVFYTSAAVPMRLRAWRSRSGSLLVELHRLSDAALREVRIQIQPQRPLWDTTNLEDQLVKVHLDDDPHGPVVVETARGILWPAPGSRRQNRVEDRLQ